MFKKVIDYLMSWSDSIVYFEEKPFAAEDVLTINLIVPSTYEGDYTPHEIVSSHTHRVKSLEQLLDLLNDLDDYVEVTIQFVLRDGRCRYMNICSHPQQWGIAALDEFINDLATAIVNGEQSINEHEMLVKMFDRGPEVSV